MAKQTRKQTYQPNYEGPDALISVTVFLPGQKPAEIKLSIKNVMGHLPRSQINSDLIRECIVDGLKSKFGDHIK